MLDEPDLFKEGMRLYRNRTYKEAQGKFTACREAYKTVDDLPGNYSTLAGFYEIECSRRTGDFEGMVRLMDDFRPGALEREEHKNQLEVLTVWTGVRTKSWRKILMDTPEMLAQDKWTGTQLAQIYYCRGLALEGMNEPIKALTAFNGTITADYTASQELTKKATLNCLRIIKDLEEVQLADSLTFLNAKLGSSNSLVQKIMAGKPPQARARELVRGTDLQDVTLRRSLYDGGEKAIAASADPMIEGLEFAGERS